MVPGVCLVSYEGTHYRVIEVVQGTVSLCPVGRSTIVTYKLCDLPTRFDMGSVPSI